MAPEPVPGLRIVLIDDHQMVAESLALALTSRGVDVVARATRLAEGIALVDQHDPDLVLLDFRLPDGDGLTGIRGIHATRPGTPVLVLTAVADPRTATDVLAAGAAGYLTKDLPVADLVAAVREAAGGHTTIPPELLGRVVSRLRSPALQPGATLTEREREALGLLADGSGIADVAHRMNVTRNTARKHVQAVLTKLGAHTQLEAVATARREGLLDH